MAAERRRATPPRLGPVLALAAIRFALAFAGVGGAIAAGASRRPATLAFTLGMLGGAVFVLSDPRRKLAPPRPAPVPRDEPWLWTAARATYPSTLGLAVLAGIALAFSPVLAAVLAGIVGGLGIAGLLVALALRV